MVAFGKTKLLTVLSAALLLAGCGSQPLSGRELVRAAFFGQEEGKSTVLLLLADQDAPEGQTAYKTAEGRGATPAQALHDAAQTLDGVVFYGLMDVVGLPADSTWRTAADIGGLLYDEAKPTPELSVYLLQGDETADNAGDVYESLMALEKNQTLHCGLQQLFEQDELCALPIRQEQGYGFALLPKNGEPAHFTDASAAQLTAALCGQTTKFDFAYAGGNARCQAAVDVTVLPEAGTTQVQLHLRDPDITLLTGALRDEASARATLCAELLTAFSDLCQTAQTQNTDPFRLQFWTAVKFGASTPPAPPKLEILFE